MPKQLYFMRHAETNLQGNSDFQRQLTKKGKKQAIDAGKNLLANGCKINYIVASSAARTLTTAKLVNTQLKLAQANLTTTELLYNVSIKSLLEVIQTLPQSQEVCLIVGHNPSLGEIVSYLSEQPLISFNNCDTYGLQLLVDDWAAVEKGMGQIIYTYLSHK